MIVPAAGRAARRRPCRSRSRRSPGRPSTASPAATCHSTSVPSVTDSPAVGVTMSIVSPAAAASGSVGAARSAPSLAGGGAARGLAVGAVPRCGRRAVAGGDLGEHRADLRPCRPRRRGSSTTVPLAGAGTSASTLSVETSTRTSSASTGSPSCLCHSRTVPSVTDSPICGRVTCTVVSTAISAPFDSSARFRPEVEFVQSASGVSLFVVLTLLPQPRTHVCHESGGRSGASRSSGRSRARLAPMSATASRPKVRPLDPLDLDGLLSDEDRLIAETVRRFAADRVLPARRGVVRAGHAAHARARAGDRRARAARDAPQRLRLRGRERDELRGRVPRARGGRQRAARASSRCRARSRCSRSGSSAPRSRSSGGCRAWPPASSSAASA